MRILSALLVFGTMVTLSLAVEAQQAGQTSDGRGNVSEWDYLGLPDLEEKQKSSMDALRMEFLKKLLPLRSRQALVATEIGVLMAMDVPDPTAIKAKTDAVAELVGEEHLLTANILIECKKLLKPAQLKVFNMQMLAWAIEGFEAGLGLLTDPTGGMNTKSSNGEGQGTNMSPIPMGLPVGMGQMVSPAMPQTGMWVNTGVQQGVDQNSTCGSTTKSDKKAARK